MSPGQRTFVAFFLVAGVANIVAESSEASSTPLPPCGEELQDIAVFPGEEKYNQSLVVYNPSYSHLRPSFFALPKTEQDVQRCLKCSHDDYVPVVIRGGGTSGRGYSTIGSEGFVIYLSEMDEVVVDDASQVLHIGAGARMSTIYEKLGLDYIFPGAPCPAVGVAGFTLAGGYSMLSRYLGLAIDDLLSVTMVTANGSSVVEASSTAHPDLFWALRGGGGGNFGAVTKFSFQLHRSQPNYVFGTIKFGGSETREFLGLLKTAPQLPKELHLQITIHPSQEAVLEPLYIGEYDDAIELLKPYTEIATSVDLKNYPSYEEILKHFGAVMPSVSPHPLMLRSCVLKEMSDEVADIFFEIDVPKSCQIVFDHFGGVVNEVSPTATAYPHRNASFYYYALCLYSKVSEYVASEEFEDNLFDSLLLGEHCAGGYIGDVDPKVLDWQHFYYGKNYERLVEIKQAWNPPESGALHFLQAIGSTYQPRSGHYDDDESWKFSVL